MDRYRVIKDDGQAYLCTCSFVMWLPIFNAGPAYPQIVLDSLKFCRLNKGLRLHAYVLMVDHLHLIAQHSDLSGLLRDFKTWTSKEISEQLKRDNRKDLIRLIELAAPERNRPQVCKVWQEGFHPKAITSDSMMLQKMEYVHQNPVEKGFVDAPDQWRYSSARNYRTGETGVLEIDRLEALHG